MKKKLLLLIAPLLLTSCNQKSYNLQLKVLTPILAPAVAMYAFANSDNFETTTNPQQGLMPFFKTDKYDVIIAPTHGGIKQIKDNGAQFKLAATVTFGNFYIISFDKDEDETMNSGDKIVCFQENDIPGKLFKYTYGDLGLSATYVANADETKLIIENKGVLDGIQYDYIMTSEPIVTITKSEVFRNVQDDFKGKSGNKKITQASVFIRNGVDSTKANKFLKDLKESIQEGVINPDEIKKGIEKVGSKAEQLNKFGVTGVDARKVGLNVNGFGLGYKNALEIKDEIESFVNLLTNNTIGELSEEIFYQ